MITATDTRKMARESLSGKWGKGALITFCYSLIEFALNFLSNLTENLEGLNIVVSIAIIIISVPLSFGLLVSFMKLKRGEEVHAFDFLTIGFSSFSRAWKICFSRLAKLILPIILLVVSIVLLIVSTFMITYSSANAVFNKVASNNSSTSIKLDLENAKIDLFSAQLEYDMDSSAKNRRAVDSAQEKVDELEASLDSYNESSSVETLPSDSMTIPLVLLLVGLVLFFVSCIVLYVKGLHYVLSYNIAYDEPDLSSKDAVLKSKTLMTHNRGNYFVLTLSFIGWAILAVFTLGIGYFWLLPYMQVALVCFYDTLANKQQNDTEIEPQDTLEV